MVYTKRTNLSTKKPHITGIFGINSQYRLSSVRKRLAFTRVHLEIARGYTRTLAERFRKGEFIEVPSEPKVSLETKPETNQA